MASLRLDERLLAAPLPEGIIFERISQHELLLQVPAAQSVNQILDSLSISLTQGVAAICKGQTMDLTQLLTENDQVRLIPQIAGGD